MSEDGPRTLRAFLIALVVVWADAPLLLSMIAIVLYWRVGMRWAAGDLGKEAFSKAGDDE